MIHTEEADIKESVVHGKNNRRHGRVQGEKSINTHFDRYCFVAPFKILLLVGRLSICPLCCADHSALFTALRVCVLMIRVHKYAINLFHDHVESLVHEKCNVG